MSSIGSVSGIGVTRQVVDSHRGHIGRLAAIVTSVLALLGLSFLFVHPAASEAALDKTARDSRVAPVYINAFYTDARIEPTKFHPGGPVGDDSACWPGRKNYHYVADIQWTSWGGEKAVGNGMAGIDCFFFEGEAERSSVSIELGDKRECAGILVYTSYRLQLQPGATEPPGWDWGQSGKFPCNPGVPGCNPEVWDWRGPFRKQGPSQCGPIGLIKPSGPGRDVYASWSPHPPPSTRPFKRILNAKWKNWAASSTFGKGAFLDSQGSRTDLWPATIKLSRPIWCPSIGERQLQGAYGDPISYSRLKLTLFGPPLRVEKGRDYGYFEALQRRVTRMVGRKGLEKHVYRQKIGSGTDKQCGQ